MLWLQIKYAQLLSGSLERFKIKENHPFKANLRCPYCGDSKKKKTKARGWIYEHEGALFYKCFNGGCDISKSFSSFLKDQNPALYEDYKIEEIKSNSSFFNNNIPTENKKKEEKILGKIELPLVWDLDFDNPAKKYVLSRKIPLGSPIYYTDKFYHFINELIPNKFSDKMLKRDVPRIVFLFKDENGEVFGCQGRIIENFADQPRYITIMFKKREKVFGLDRIDCSKRIHVVEGPIDSLFLENSVAFTGAQGKLSFIKDINNCTVVLDNEPRNKAIVSAMFKYAEHGYPVCVWPSWLKEKDINDMILAGYSKNEIQKIIDEHTYSGLEAELKLIEYKKIGVF